MTGAHGARNFLVPSRRLLPKKGTRRSRKEVFQPHLPVRLYKARERIHRAMADARLLANPASRSRVADSGPNWGTLSGSAPRRRVAPLCMPHCNTCVAPDVRAVLI